MEAEPWIVLLRGTDQRQCSDFALVLEARGIRWTLDTGGSDWVLRVPLEDAESAAAELSVYRSENARAAVPPSPQPVGGGWFGVASFVAVLVTVAVLAQQLSLGVDWLAVGRVEGARMLDGEWWRALTALTLHVDADHLLGNIAFGAFFTYFVGRYLGSGVGWFAILMSGALGNLLNGWLAAPDHRSIGASTAVFGALGLLPAHTWRRGFPPGTSFRGRVAPLIAGLGLLAYTGTGGANTDIGAHLTGFVSGFGIGLLAARYQVPGARQVQLTAGCAAWLLLVGAWAWGIAAIY
jgi:membrane associated rhomboid family serine protease